MKTTILHLYSDIHLDAGLPTVSPEMTDIDNWEELLTLARAIKRRYPGGEPRVVSFPAILTGSYWTQHGVAYDPGRDAPYIDVWSPVRLTDQNGDQHLSVVVSGTVFTFVKGEDALNKAIAMHIRWSVGDGPQPPTGINEIGGFVDGLRL